jgi:hypothetical protein
MFTFVYLLSTYYFPPNQRQCDSTMKNDGPKELSPPCNLSPREYTYVSTYIGLEVLIAAVMESAVFWDTTPYYSVVVVRKRIISTERPPHVG